MIAVRRPATIAVAIALGGCGSLPPMPPLADAFRPPPLSVRVTEAAAAAPVVLARRQTLVVVLEADVTTGYRWEALPGYVPTLVALGTPDYTMRTAQPAAGASGDMTFRFSGDAPGTTALEFAYRRPFEPEVAPAKTLRFDVTVQ
jgi:inhibitor of cysteine peptidase